MSLVLAVLGFLFGCTISPCPLIFGPRHNKELKGVIMIPEGMIKTWVETMLRSAQIDPQDLQAKIADMIERHIRMEQRQVRIEEKLDLLLDCQGVEYCGATLANSETPQLTRGTDNGG